MRIKEGDMVIVIAGNDRDLKTPRRVLKVDRVTGRVVVEGVNRVLKHVRRGPKNPQGGRLSKEMPIDASNVMLVCPQTGQPTRIGAKILADGSKVRICRKSGAEAGVIAPPKTRKATAAKK